LLAKLPIRNDKITAPERKNPLVLTRTLRYKRGNPALLCRERLTRPGD
jgi:hypothetical protein